MNFRILVVMRLLAGAFCADSYAAECSQHSLNAMQSEPKSISDKQMRIMLFNSHGMRMGYKDFSASLTDLHSGKPLLEYLGQKISCVFALFSCLTPEGKIETGLAEGRNWFQYCPKELSNGNTVMASVQYLLVSKQGEELIASVMGTDYEARSDLKTPRIELLRLELLQQNQDVRRLKQTLDFYHQLKDSEKSLFLTRTGFERYIQYKATGEFPFNMSADKSK